MRLILHIKNFANSIVYFFLIYTLNPPFPISNCLHFTQPSSHSFHRFTFIPSFLRPFAIEKLFLYLISAIGGWKKEFDKESECSATSVVESLTAKERCSKICIVSIYVVLRTSVRICIELDAWSLCGDNGHSIWYFQDEEVELEIEF